MIFSRIKEEDGYSKGQIRRHDLIRKALMSAIVLGLTLIPMGVAVYFRINDDERWQMVLLPTMAVFFISLLYTYWQLRKVFDEPSDAKKSDEKQTEEK
jgi:uncharacterized membrane protein YqjE